MSDIAIRVENLSKQYRLGEIGTGTLSHDLNRWWHKIRGKDDPYLQVGETNDRAKEGGQYVWALRDISFEVKKGEVLGIIGKNGAGKSTLLKILSKVTGPTTGTIKARGRIASLLEVGTGFHPEMTGRENIYMNGTIMGMTRREIKAKLDEIVEFAGVAKYLDTPVKRYSSGMKVRLGFAVAAHLEPEILIVDEVLAVGDAEFQKKAIGKMQDVSKGEGRTVLFVSHNMASVKNLCTRATVLERGAVVTLGEVKASISFYQNLEKSEGCFKIYPEGKRPSSPWVELLGYQLLNEKKQPIEAFNLYEDALIQIDYRVKEDLGGEGALYPNLHFFDETNQYFFVTSIPNEQACSEIGEYSTIFRITKNTFNTGLFRVGIAITSYPGTHVHFFINPAFTFEVLEEKLSHRETVYSGSYPGVSRFRLPTETLKI